METHKYKHKANLNLRRKISREPNKNCKLYSYMCKKQIDAQGMIVLVSSTETYVVLKTSRCTIRQNNQGFPNLTHIKYVKNEYAITPISW